MKDFIKLYNKLVVKINDLIDTVYILESDCNKNYKNLNDKLSNIKIDINYSDLEFNTEELIDLLIGLVNDDNTITLFSLEDGSYSLKYEYEDGTLEELIRFNIGNEVTE